MGKETGFREFERKTPSHEPVASRITHYREFLIPLPQEEVEIQGARCMNCGVPFCHAGCPLGNVIPDFNDLVYRGRWEAALRSLASTNNFPEFTGRVCPAPCESACVLGINRPPVTIKHLELSIVERAFAEGWIAPRPPAVRTGRRVAVIGSGPAGLACAHQLNKAGHTVTVFERADRIGGLLRYGIPDFKLDKAILDRRLNLLAREGVVFRTNAHVGLNLPASQVLGAHDAVVLAGGATRPRDLPIPGRGAAGVRVAMDFLTASNRRVAGDVVADDTLLATGLDVVVLGGGDTGSDCVGTAIRQGARSVTQVEILPRPASARTVETPWPTHPGPRMFSTSTSQAEGCAREWGVISKAFLETDAGRVRAIRCARVEWSDGRPVEIPGSEFELKADLVLLALGFVHAEHAAIDDIGVQKDDRGNCRADGAFRTTRAGVFTAGDMRRGQSLVVWALLDGRECAREVDAFLAGRPSLLAAKSRALSDTAFA